MERTSLPLSVSGNVTPSAGGAPVIAINAICPGVIRTEIDTDVTDRAEEVIKGIALGRLGCADDVARLVTFLATSEPCFMTGQTLTVDGFQFNV